MSLNKTQWEFTYHIACLIHYAYDIHGIRLSFGEAHRTQSQVYLNFFGYKIVRGGVLGIKLKKSRKLSHVLYSSHQDRLAVDFNFFFDDPDTPEFDGRLSYRFNEVKPLGDYWESLHPKNVWGGDFNKDDVENGFVDTPHFERRK